MILPFLTLLAADVVYGALPPVKPCDDLAYISFSVPPPPSPPMMHFIGPMPMAAKRNRELPAVGTAAETYAEHWKRYKDQPMRRRGQ